MENRKSQNIYNLNGEVTVVTGGAGVFCSGLCHKVATECVKVSVLDLNVQADEALVTEIRSSGGEAIGLASNVLEKTNVKLATKQTLAAFGRVDILLNGAGGNKPQATTNAGMPFYSFWKYRGEVQYLS